MGTAWNMLMMMQDALKTWQKCVAATKEAVAKGNSVVIDNTNPDVESRRRWLVTAVIVSNIITCHDLQKWTLLTTASMWLGCMHMCGQLLYTLVELAKYTCLCLLLKNSYAASNAWDAEYCYRCRSVCPSVSLVVCCDCTEWPWLGYTVWGHSVQSLPNYFGPLFVFRLVAWCDFVTFCLRCELKIVPEMTYKVSSGTSNRCSLTHLWTCGIAVVLEVATLFRPSMESYYITL